MLLQQSFSLLYWFSHLLLGAPKQTTTTPSVEQSATAGIGQLFHLVSRVSSIDLAPSTYRSIGSSQSTDCEKGVVHLSKKWAMLLIERPPLALGTAFQLNWTARQQTKLCRSPKPRSPSAWECKKWQWQMPLHASNRLGRSKRERFVASLCELNVCTVRHRKLSLGCFALIAHEMTTSPHSPATHCSTDWRWFLQTREVFTSIAMKVQLSTVDRHHHRFSPQRSISRQKRTKSSTKPHRLQSGKGRQELQSLTHQ